MQYTWEFSNNLSNEVAWIHEFSIQQHCLKKPENKRKKQKLSVSWNIYLPRLLTSHGKTIVSAVATRHLFPVVMKDGERSDSGTDFEATVNKNSFHQYHMKFDKWRFHSNGNQWFGNKYWYVIYCYTGGILPNLEGQLAFFPWILKTYNPTESCMQFNNL